MVVQNRAVIGHAPPKWVCFVKDYKRLNMNVKLWKTAVRVGRNASGVFSTMVYEMTCWYHAVFACCCHIRLWEHPPVALLGSEFSILRMRYFCQSELTGCLTNLFMQCLPKKLFQVTDLFVWCLLKMPIFFLPCWHPQNLDLSSSNIFVNIGVGFPHISILHLPFFFKQGAIINANP